jgi:hypothetical protein
MIPAPHRRASGIPFILSGRQATQSGASSTDAIGNVTAQNRKMEKLTKFLTSVKALIVAGIALLALLVLVSGTITDYARLPARVEQLDAKIDTVATMAQDLRFLVCVEKAEQENRSTMECFEDWRAAEARK